MQKECLSWHLSRQVRLVEESASSPTFRQAFLLHLHRPDGPLKLGGLDWTAEVGLTPWEGTYADKFNVTNLTLAAAKEVPITSKFSLPLFAQVTFNPYTQGAYFVFGLSL